jgi:hypothetical protein
MPFINGRYHVNPVMGQALEAAREAEAALVALQQRARKNSSDARGDAPSDDSADSDDPSSTDDPAGAGPIHHIEIEVTQLLPAHSGRATRGFVAHVHRTPPSSAVVVPGSSPRRTTSVFSSGAARGIPLFARDDSSPMDRPTPPPETHVFSDHGDLVNFLRDALASDGPQR